MKSLFAWFRKLPCLQFAGTALALSASALWLWTLAGPSADTARLRTALIADVGQPADFAWQPDNTPGSFMIDTTAPPKLFQEVVAGLSLPDPASPNELQIGEAIARRLMSAPTRLDGPIRADTLTTYSQITGDGLGYCADFSKVFNGLAETANLPVRQWGFSFSAFGAGHTFNEIYDRTLRKWVMVDSFHSLLFLDSQTHEPLSVIEVHDRLLGLHDDQREVAIQRLVPEHFPFRSDQLAIDYYRRGMPQLYLVWGTNVFDYEQRLGYRMLSGISRHVEQLAAILLGDYPRIRIYPEGVSDRDVDELFRVRNSFFIATGCLLTALLVLAAQLLSFRRSHA